MTNQAHEFKESLAEICKLSGIGMCPGCGLTPEGLQNILDAHTAHLVERIENMAIVDDYGEERKIGFQIAKDQAIDIVKDKPPTV